MTVDSFPMRNIDTATADASELVWDLLARHVWIPRISATKRERALGPGYGVAWNKALLTTIGKDRANNARARLRNPTLRRSEYDWVVDFLEEAFADSPLFPPDMME